MLHCVPPCLPRSYNLDSVASDSMTARTYINKQQGELCYCNLHRFVSLGLTLNPKLHCDVLCSFPPCVGDAEAMCWQAWRGVVWCGVHTMCLMYT
jgi:hypothetical protein